MKISSVTTGNFMVAPGCSYSKCELLCRSLGVIFSPLLLSLSHLYIGTEAAIFSLFPLVFFILTVNTGNFALNRAAH